MIQRLYAFCGWGIVALGGLHMSATPRFFDALTGSALWFFSGGITMVLAGSINLLNRSYGRHAAGLRWACVGTNFLILAFAIVSGIVGRASFGQFAIVLGLIGGATVLSTTRSAWRTLPHSLVNFEAG